MFISGSRTSGFRCVSVIITTSGFVRSHHSLSSGTFVWSHLGKWPLMFHSIRLFIHEPLELGRGLLVDFGSIVVALVVKLDVDGFEVWGWLEHLVAVEHCGGIVD